MLGALLKILFILYKMIVIVNRYYYCKKYILIGFTCIKDSRCTKIEREVERIINVF